MLPTWPTPDPRTATVLFRQSLTTLTSQGRVRPSTLRLRRPPAHAYACVFLDRHVPAPSRSRCDQRSQPSLCDGSAPRYSAPRVSHDASIGVDEWNPRRSGAPTGASCCIFVTHSQSLCADQWRLDPTGELHGWHPSLFALV